ncbi:MAG: hypothetical protein WKF78_09810 [Candidatus Limnocylindrales bacterium]
MATPTGGDLVSLLPALGVALDIDEALVQELAGDPDGLVDVAARVAAKIEHDALGARLACALQRLDQLVRSTR